MNRLPFELSTYPNLKSQWPQSGRHILASYDDESVIVYQAYRQEIAEWAIEHQRFGGPWSLGRMSWIKPNFLWMMYRSGWASKPGQEYVLAVRIKREGFEQCLAQAQHSSYCQARYKSEEAWRSALGGDVRLQWDPDHHPRGAKVERRAIQLGLRGLALERYAHDWTLSITDVSDFVRQQASVVQAGAWDKLELPAERVYIPKDAHVSEQLQLSLAP